MGRRLPQIHRAGSARCEEPQWPRCQPDPQGPRGHRRASCPGKRKTDENSGHRSGDVRRGGCPPRALPGAGDDEAGCEGTQGTEPRAAGLQLRPAGGGPRGQRALGRRQALGSRQPGAAQLPPPGSPARRWGRHLASGAREGDRSGGSVSPSGCVGAFGPPRGSESMADPGRPASLGGADSEPDFEYGFRTFLDRGLGGGGGSLSTNSGPWTTGL